MIEIPPTCPISNGPGQIRQRRSGSDLLRAYQTRYGISIPPTLATRYFEHTFSECECRRSGLRWFSPSIVGFSDFYEYLASSLPWYYSGETWDKKHALATLKKLKCRSMFEVGCGSGELIRAAADAGLAAAGSELNEQQLESAAQKGLSIFRPDKIPQDIAADALVMLQVLEHVPRPLEFTSELVKRFQPRYLLIAVPSFETLLGRTTDPLVWPPHHISYWSAKALDKLADLIGFDLVSVTYQPLEWSWFAAVAGTEPQGRLQGFPPIRDRQRLRLIYEFGRLLHRPWALRAHTVFGVLEFSP